MALIPFKTKAQDFSVTGTAAGELCSQTFIECSLTCASSNETITIPVQICTKIQDMKVALCAKLGYIDGSNIYFVIKQGCTFRVMLDSDQVARRMTVRGIKSFKPPLHKYPHPYGVIGAGYNGLKTALWLLKDGQKDFVIFDRYDRVGGHCWLECANRTTRLQTEFSTYHIWYGKEWSTAEHTLCGGAPKDWEIWPSANRVLEHFQLCAEEYGILPHCRFNTDVESVELKGRLTDTDRSYSFLCVPKVGVRKETQGGGRLDHQLSGEGEDQSMASMGYAKGFKRDQTKEPWVFTCSCFCIWPGNLCNPRQVTYKGEDVFEGLVEYGVEMRFDYNNVIGKNVIIHGHGAFTMENIRTCCEYGAKHVYVVCRRRNLTCPRVASWFINQSNPPCTGVQVLDILKVMYSLADYDPWNMHSVSTNANRTHATFNQITRFGIGDIYFLAAAMGVMEIVVDNIKRLSNKTVHLESGLKLEDISCILKCTGMLPDWTVDKVVKAKFLKGFWINGDVRRFTCADPNGIMASNFGATTVGPGSYGWVRMMKHFWDVPNDWQQLEDSGQLALLPIHNSGDPDPDIPAYFIDARHATGTSVALSGLSPLLAEKSAGDGDYKHWVQHYCTPPERLLQVCMEEWDDYQRHFKEKGMVPQDAPYLPYPYSIEYIHQQYEVHKADITRQYEQMVKKTTK